MTKKERAVQRLRDKRAKAATAATMVRLQEAQRRLKVFEDLVDTVMQDVFNDAVERRVREIVDEAISDLDIQINT